MVKTALLDYGNNNNTDRRAEKKNECMVGSLLDA